MLLSPALRVFALAGLCLFAPGAVAQEVEGTLKEVPFQNLSDRGLTPLGQAAMSIHPADWKHAETTNFIYHFFHGFIAAPVSVEAEFYYRVISKDLEKDTTQWERKSHIFIFETDADWKEFQKKGALDPWTGGIHSQGSLFIQRNPERKFKGSTLGHEVTHLVIERFFGAGVPLWLNEGYAEYSASRCYAAFNRARGYLARPTARPVPADLYIPAAQLVSMVTYPKEETQVGVFYNESQRLVRFLSHADKHGFEVFLEAMSKGNRFETALNKGFAARFINTDTLDREFKTYATQENGLTNAD
jgi:hypothetical protein